MISNHCKHCTNKDCQGCIITLNSSDILEYLVYGTFIFYLISMINIIIMSINTLLPIKEIL